MFGNSFDKAMKGAEDVLGKWDKITGAITGEQGKLLALIPDLLDRDNAVREAEATEALGEGNGAAKARRARDAARSDIDRYGERLSGLRGRRAGLTAGLVSARDGLARELPVHYAEVKAGLLAEWQQALETLRPLLKRRAQLQRLLGEPLILPELAAAPGDAIQTEIDEPQARLTEIETALNMVEYGARTARYASEPGGPGPYTVYRLQRPAPMNKPIGGLPEGSHVVSACLAAGELAHLAQSRWAHPVADSDLHRAGMLARAALGRAEAEKAERERLAEVRRRDAADTEYLRLHPEEAARRRSEEMRQAAVVEERRRQGYGEGPTPRPVAAGLSQIVVPEFTQHPDTGA